jgi:hypothetical protein
VEDALYRNISQEFLIYYHIYESKFGRAIGPRDHRDGTAKQSKAKQGKASQSLFNPFSNAIRSVLQGSEILNFAPTSSQKVDIELLHTNYRRLKSRESISGS